LINRLDYLNFRKISALRHQTPTFYCFSIHRFLNVLEPLLEEFKQMLDGEAPLKWDPSN
jgi:hypothetical protein